MKSVYIHIPFCKDICSYCDFCKLYYNNKWVKDYLIALEKEIKNNYNKEIIETLYIGGGTPSALNIDELKILFNILSVFNLTNLKEFTFECNIESLDKEKLLLLKENGVNRLSIGVQTFNNNNLKLLNRNHTKEDIYNTIKLIRSIGFNNINLDLIYGINNQDINELENDLKCILEINPEHISCYSLSINPNTKMYIDNIKEIDQDIDYEMYSYIENVLTSNEYNHYEISNYSKDNKQSIHNLTYWNNEEYYGFGLGASGYINNIRYDNTRNYSKYINNDYIKNKVIISNDDKIKYELIVGFRKIIGINKHSFLNKYNKNLKDINNIRKLIDKNKLFENDEYIYVNREWIYKLNEILVELV